MALLALTSKDLLQQEFACRLSRHSQGGQRRRYQRLLFSLSWIFNCSLVSERAAPKRAARCGEVSAETRHCSCVKHERGGEPGQVWCASCPCLWRAAKLSWCGAWAVSACCVQNLSRLLSLHVVLGICSWRGQRFCFAYSTSHLKKAPIPYIWTCCKYCTQYIQVKNQHLEV